MNMLVTNTASLIASASSQGGTAKSSGGDGFAGVLVQALGGQSSSNSAESGLALPTNIAALLGQVGTEGKEGDEDSLLSVLNEWLQQLSDSQGEDLTSEDSQNALNELLAALQALLQNWTIPADAVAGNFEADGDNAATTAASASSNGGQSGTLMMLLQALNQAAKNHNGKLDANTLESVAEQLKQIVASGTATGEGLNLDTQAEKPVEPSRVGILQTIGTTGVQQQAATQAVHQQAAVDNRKATTFKEPVIYWNLHQESTSIAPKTDSSVVQSANESNASENNGTTFAWTLQAQDMARPKADIPAAKPALPAQVPVQQFSQQIGNYLVKQFVLSNGNGFTEARITLAPEHLGTVDVRLSMQDGQLTAQFVTHSGTAKELIENQMGMLRSSLQSQGIQVDRIDVVQQPYEASDSTSFMSDEDRGSNAGQGGGHSNHSRHDAIEDQATFEDELERTTLIREIGFGGSINTTA